MSLTLAPTGNFPFLNYDSTHTKDFYGWNYTAVLTIALPIMFTALALAVVFALEVALKTQIISVQEQKLPPAPPLGNPHAEAGTVGGPGAGGVTAPGPVPGATANKYADPAQQGYPEIPLQPDQRAGGVQPPPIGSGPVAVPEPVLLNPAASPTHKSLYAWEEILIFFVFHVVSCVFYVQPRQRSQNALGPVLAWIHLVGIAGYTFVIVGVCLTFSTRRSKLPASLHQPCSS